MTRVMSHRFAVGERFCTLTRPTTITPGKRVRLTAQWQPHERLAMTFEELEQFVRGRAEAVRLMGLDAELVSRECWTEVAIRMTHWHMPVKSHA